MPEVNDQAETAELSAVRAADRAWAEAAASKNVERMLACYAPDAMFTSRTRGLCRGHEALREAWSALFARRGYALMWRATTVAVSAAGDLANSIGSWERKGSRWATPNPDGDLPGDLEEAGRRDVESRRR